MSRRAQRTLQSQLARRSKRKASLSLEQVESLLLAIAVEKHKEKTRRETKERVACAARAKETKPKVSKVGIDTGKQSIYALNVAKSKDLTKGNPQSKETFATSTLKLKPNARECLMQELNPQIRSLQLSTMSLITRKAFPLSKVWTS